MSMWCCHDRSYKNERLTQASVHSFLLLWLWFALLEPGEKQGCASHTVGRATPDQSAAQESRIRPDSRAIHWSGTIETERRQLPMPPALQKGCVRRGNWE